MKTLDFTTALAEANKLPQDASTPIDQPFQSGVHHYTTLYCTPTPASLFVAMTHGKMYASYGNGKLYTRSLKTDENGQILPKGIWREVLYFHKKWARKDVEVKAVSYDIVGLKRKSTHLPAGVLVTNINFNIE